MNIDSWFEYYQSSADLNSSNPGSKKRSLLRRSLKLNNIVFDISKNQILRVPVHTISINKKLTASLEYEYDEDSYLIVYQTVNGFYPVQSYIEYDVLYFRAAESHLRNVELNGVYYIYYGQPNIKYLYKTYYFGDVVYKQYTSSEITLINSGSLKPEFSLRRDNINNFLNTVYCLDYGKYSMNFVNADADWSITSLDIKPDIDISSTSYSHEIESP